MGIVAGTMKTTTRVSIMDHTVAIQRSKEIDQLLADASRQNMKVIKMLLLGAGESGKSTIVKQMRLIHGTGFFKSERLDYKLIIFSNVIQSAIAILRAMDKLKIEFEVPERKADAKFCTQYVNQVECGAMDITLPMAAAIGRLWRDEGFYRCYSRSEEYQLIDSAEYFFDEVFRLASPDYLPTDQDMVMARLRTTGVKETRFEYKNTTFRLVDVGGQRAERRKWIHCFDDVNVMLFLVALSEYNMTLREDNKTNRLEESKTIFNSICNSVWFKHTPVVIFFNKSDIFADKIQRIPINVCFPEYKGGLDHIQSREYICKQFLKLNCNRKRQMYHHYTNATDTRNMKFILDASMDTIMKVNLQTIGFL